MSNAIWVFVPESGWSQYHCGPCTRQEGYHRTLDILSDIAGQAFVEDSTVLNHDVAEVKRSSQLLEILEEHSRDFRYQARSGFPGWFKLWSWLQGCPLVHIALELAMAFSIWMPGQEVKHEWITMDLVEPERAGLEVRTHLARALSYAESWRHWAENPQNEEFLGCSKVGELCRAMVSTKWIALNNFAEIALRGVGCRKVIPWHVGFGELLGCQRNFPSLAEICEPLVLEPPTQEGSFADFWNELRAKLILAPTLQMPLGLELSGPHIPHLMGAILAKIVAPMPASLGAPLFLEFGVHNGSSINFIARALQQATRDSDKNEEAPIIYGFDSFQGLPTHWRKVFGSSSGAFRAGSYGLPKLPEVEWNAVLVPGWFNETLPPFVRSLQTGVFDSSMPSDVVEHARRAIQGEGGVWVRFVHVDCDLYSSTSEVLQGLAPFFRSGTILVFDELVNYPEFQEHEVLALFEFLRDHRWTTRILYAPWHVISEASEFLALEMAGVNEGDLIQSVAIELVSNLETS